MKWCMQAESFPAFYLIQEKLTHISWIHKCNSVFFSMLLRKATYNHLADGRHPGSIMTRGQIEDIRSENKLYR